MQHTDSKAQNETPHAISAMREHRVTVANVARSLGLSHYTVTRALAIEHCPSVGHGTVLQVRQRVYKMLRAAGWEGTPTQLWREYDEPLTKAA